MRYHIHAPYFVWGDDYHIRDDAERDVYFVDGHGFAIANKLSFQDMQGNELAFLKEQLLVAGQAYEIYRAGALAARVQKEPLTRDECRFCVDLPGPNDPLASGDFYNHEYELKRDGQVIARVSRQLAPPGAHFGVEISAGQDDVLLLSAMIVIDLISHPAAM